MRQAPHKRLSPFKLGSKKYFPYVSGLILVMLLLIAHHLAGPQAKPSEWLLPAIAAAAGLHYFLCTQHMQRTEFFDRLFREFNKRYDEQNDELNQIAGLDTKRQISVEQQQRLCDYFNLCAEEFLYYKSGFIDEEVWISWCAGMRGFAQVEHIRKLWARELQSGSHYGFCLKLVDGALSCQCCKCGAAEAKR